MLTTLKKHRKFGIPLLAILAVALVPAAQAEERVEVGDKMPDFTLTDYEGNEHTLSALEGQIVVLDFRSQNCPYSRGTDPQIAQVAEKYSKEGVVFLGIDSDRTNDAAKVEEYAKKTGIPYPILKDDQNVYADAVYATRTPEIYIVKDGELKFHGAFDNRTVPDVAGDVNYVAQALDELMAGKAVSTPSVSAWGCTIKRVSKKASTD